MGFFDPIIFLSTFWEASMRRECVRAYPLGSLRTVPLQHNFVPFSLRLFDFFSEHDISDHISF